MGRFYTHLGLGKAANCYLVGVSPLAERLGQDRPLILDGPTGTELERRGFVSHPILWTAAASERADGLLSAVHRDYLLAGAELLTANTFRTTAYAAQEAGVPAPVDTARAWLRAAVAVAKAACKGHPDRRFVLGSLAPLADCYRPEETPPDAVLHAEHGRTAAWLAQAGCDGILVETQGCGREALVAVAAAHKAGGVPVLVSFLPDETGTRLLGGDVLFDCAAACLRAGAAAVLVNCSHSQVLGRALATLRPLAERGVVLGAYPNASHRITSGARMRWQTEAAASLGQVGQGFYRAGARILGACCGFGPASLAELAAALREAA